MRAEIAERKAEILAYLGQQEACKRFVPPPVKPRGSTDPAPLSFAQERLWFLEQLESEAAVYNICRASHLLGKLSFAALEASLNEIASRHDTLRTAFKLIDGHPVQIVQPSADVSIKTVDLSSLPQDKRRTEIAHTIKAEAESPFDLSAGGLLRCTVIRAGDNDHVLILTTHHSVSDAWSMGILTRELWTLYEAYSKGNSSPLEPLPVQYSDYAIWQHNWFQGGVLESQLAYWKKSLQDLSILNLPTDRPRKPRQSFRGARLPIVLPEDLARSVNELSDRFAVTPFMTLLAAFQVLLYRYTGQEDVVVGSPIANRRRPELEGLIGFFVNSLVLRGDLSGNPSFRDLLLRTRDLCVAADANQDLPFEKLVQELQPGRDQSRNPLFQVMFVLQNATRPFSGIPGLRIEPMEVTTTRSPFDLSLFLRERDGKYIGYIEYSADLFDPDRIERMAGHFQTLLEGIVSDPNQSIATLPILTEAERHQILVEWNDTAADYPKDKCIHHLFEEQVERTPEAIAVEFEDQQITYRELNCRANQLAHYLITLGIGPEKLVGICVERSIEMVVGLLGILKAGGAYVPLDPTYPDERLRFMLEDAQVSVLLTQEKLFEDRGWRIEDRNSQASILDPPFKAVCLDHDVSSIAAQSDENPSLQIQSSNLAYVIYTSGSTGQPKGVAIEHGNTTALLHWARGIFTAEELSGVVASTSICFDLSVFELFVPLSWGGQIILVKNVLHLANGSGSHHPTLINTVPSAMTELLKINGLPESVRTVNLAGEPLRSELVEQIYASGNVNKVYDLYGPSETTTYSTFTLRASNQLATIGRPIANTRIYILDGSLQPVPVGVTGEIFIGGAGVARGYLDRDDLTAERFVHNPFRPDAVERVYRTGDRARYRSDGNIVYLGRIDNQVKIRGCRIELGEIEATINQHPNVKQSAVVVREVTQAGKRQLLAYFVSKNGSSSTSDLLTFLKNKLPNYMVPAQVIELETLPLTTTGKLDRRALPLLTSIQTLKEQEFFAPRTVIEELVGQVWREVLRVDTLSIHDNFFELGGHSLLGIQIVARLRETFDRDIPLATLLDAPTVADVSVEIERQLRDGNSPIFPPIVPVPRDRPLPLSMNQEHLWHMDKLMPGTHFLNMPYVYRLSGELNVEALGKALKEIVRRHEALRTVFRETDGQPYQIIEDGASFELTEIDLRARFDGLSEAAANLLLEERLTPFDLSLGPLFRSKLLRLTKVQNLLLLTLHHIISDHWSMQVILRELTILYGAYARNLPNTLAEPPVQFADFAVWEQRCWQSGYMKSQMDYCMERIVGHLSKSDSIGLSHGGSKVGFERLRRPIVFNEQVFSTVIAIARQESVTPFMVLVALLSLAIFTLTGNGWIRLGTIVANRGQRSIENTVGHFMNTVVLYLNISSGMSLRALLRQVRTATLASYMRQELPFEQLSRTFELETGNPRASMFQVLLSYQTGVGKIASDENLKISPFSLQIPDTLPDLTPTTFDLIVRLREISNAITGEINVRSDVSFETLDSLVDLFSGSTSIDRLYKNDFVKPSLTL